MSIFLAAPVVPPPPPAQEFDWSGTRSVWTGWDGSVWDLSSPESGVRLKRRGVEGLGMPPVSRYTDVGPAVPGSTWRGYRVAERPVFWPVGVYAGGGSADWLAYDRAWWSTLHPARPGVWSVIQPDGTTRSLRCRFASDGPYRAMGNPARRGWEVYGIELVAEHPFWEGRPRSRTFEAGTSAGFFGGSGGPPFTISSGSTLAGASMDNPGDEPAYPVWTITAGTGGITSVEVGVGGRVIEVPFELAEGVSLVIDPRPTEQTAIDSTGTDRTVDLGAVDFAPIPPGQARDLSLSMVGAGTVRADLTPLYLRAW